MFQVLLTSRFFHLDARLGQITTEVLFFQTKEEAITAAQKINGGDRLPSVSQLAVCLF